MNYQQKYLKYKNKYLSLKKLKKLDGGMNTFEVNNINDLIEEKNKLIYDRIVFNDNFNTSLFENDKSILDGYINVTTITFGKTFNMPLFKTTFKYNNDYTSMETTTINAFNNLNIIENVTFNNPYFDKQLFYYNKEDSMIPLFNLEKLKTITFNSKNYKHDLTLYAEKIKRN
jgi:hypothetical protein